MDDANNSAAGDRLNRAFDSESVFTMNRHELSSLLKDAAMVKHGTPENRDRNDIRAQTIQHLLLAAHMSHADRISTRLSYATICIGIGALIAAIIQAMIALGYLQVQQ
ncbi:MAG: hypothetical protein J5I99_00070 [Verrucomicrobia bacterium]|nr:hypothetical protein [Verrucomicrobiota bacterium]